MTSTPFPLSPGAMLLRDEPLARMTSFDIGGPAELLLLPATSDDIRHGVDYARENNLPWRVIGSATNVLIADEGLPGLTIKLWKQFGKISIEGLTLSAQAGAGLLEVAMKAGKAGLSGLEFAGGIPGTVGGAVFMNAGVKEHEIKNVLTAATLLTRSGEVARESNKGLEFGYRFSALQHNGAILLDAEFRLKKGDPETVFARMNQFLDERRDRQPINQPNCGSVFRNPPGDFAGRLIDEAGCKGFRLGGVMVSDVHANFIVNDSNGTADDVISLVQEVRRRVRESSGIELKLEMRLLK